jgi:hypothetical protein
MGVLDDAIREHLELKRKHGAAEEELQRQEQEALGPARRDVAQQHEMDTGEPEVEQETTLFDGGEAPAAEDGDGAPPLGEDSPAAQPFADSAESAPPAELEPTALHEPTAAEPTSVEPPPAEPPPSAHDEPPAIAHEPPSSAEEPPALHEEPPVAGQPPVGQEPDVGSHPPTEPYQVEVHDLAGSDQDEPGPEPDPRDTRLEDTQPHGFDELDEEEPGANLDDEEDEDDDDLLASDPEHEDQDVLEDTPDFLQETPEHDRLWFEQKPPRDFDFD